MIARDRAGTWPLTYEECRARFRAAAAAAGADQHSYPIEAPGPAGEHLTVDVARLGAPDASRVLLVMSGTHGIEGFAGSMIQEDLLGSLADRLEAGTAALVHGVNPWGMAWWRRANESNVDLNRNWQSFTDDLPANAPYAEVHDLLCPDGPAVPDRDAFVRALSARSAERGLPWVRQAISGGQYSHPDGLYFGGAKREQSITILEQVTQAHLTTAEAILSIDLHTGHGAYGTYTLLSPAPLGSAADEWLRTRFDAGRIEATAANPDATSAPKVGQLAPGILRLAAPDRAWNVTLELGTRSETRMIVAERAEHWVHRFGDRDHPDHADAVWEHRVCSIPDDPEWERAGLAHGRTVLDAALKALPGL